MGDPEYSSENPSGLTFGVELEMIAFVEKQGAGDPHLEDPRWFLRYDQINGDYGRANFENLVHTKITEILRGEGFPAITKRDTIKGNVYPENLANQLHISLKAWHALRYSFWQVREDSTVRLEPEDPGSDVYHERGVAVELNSPVYEDYDTFVEDISRLCRVMRKHFRLTVNKSTGCHVHLGESRGEVRGISLLTAKKALELFLPTEINFFELCSPWRQQASAVRPLMVSSKLADVLPSDAYPDPRGNGPYISVRRPSPLQSSLQNALGKIWDAESLEILQSEVISNKLPMVDRCGVAIGSAATPGVLDGTLIRTLEVRMLQGTLDPVLLAHWVKLLLQWFKMAALADRRALAEKKTVISQHVGYSTPSRPYDYREFLHDFGVESSSAIGFWKSQLVEYDNSLKNPEGWPPFLSQLYEGKT